MFPKETKKDTPIMSPTLFDGMPLRRTKTWFAILPVTIDKKTRWFKTVTVLQELRQTNDAELEFQIKWCNVKFVDAL